MIFTLKADAQFEAENIDDAFIFLIEHFTSLSEDREPPRCFIEGGVHITPLPPTLGINVADGTKTSDRML